MKKYFPHQKGQSLVEVVLALALFTMGAAAVAYLLFSAQLSSRQSAMHVKAVLLCEEGIEAAHSIEAADFTLLPAGEHGLALSDGHFIFDGSSDTDGVFTRTLTVTDVSSTTKNVHSEVTWNFSGRTESVDFETALTNWRN